MVNNFDLETFVPSTKNLALAQGGLNPSKVIAPFRNIYLLCFVKVGGGEWNEQTPGIRFRNQRCKHLVLRRVVIGRLDRVR